MPHLGLIPVARVRREDHGDIPGQGERLGSSGGDRGQGGQGFEKSLELKRRL
jgi:hypothetical protein